LSGSGDSKSGDGNDLSITYLALDVFDADAVGEHSNIRKYFLPVIDFIEKHRKRSSHSSTHSSAHSTSYSASSSSLSTSSDHPIDSSNTTHSGSETNSTSASSNSALVSSDTTSSSSSSSSSSSVVSSGTVAPVAKAGVLVHCHSGVSRAPSLILAWLMAVRGWSLSASLEWLKERRPQILPNNGFMRQLIDFEQSLHGTTSLQKEDYPPPIALGP